jgi:hypothetical protein
MESLETKFLCKLDRIAFTCCYGPDSGHHLYIEINLFSGSPRELRIRHSRNRSYNFKKMCKTPIKK